jgi:VanZ family protein
VADAEAQPTTRPSQRLLASWLPVVAWAGLIFALSAQSSLPFIADQPIGFGKLGHMTIFGVLTVLLWRALARTTSLHRPWAWALVLAIAYAFTDEIHQSFVPGRDPSLLDVGIDTAGAMISLAISGFVVARWTRRRMRASSRLMP